MHKNTKSLQSKAAAAMTIKNRIIYLEECDSTNTEAQRLLRDFNVSEGTIVTAFRQIKGRGRRGTSWEAEPGSNLTFSVILFPSFLTPEQQFYLSICAALGITDALFEEVGETLKIKWPNDIYVGDKKLGGILIENQWQGGLLKSSVVGIGLNINQTIFETSEAVSLKQATHRHYDTHEVLLRVAKHLNERYAELRVGGFLSLRKDYLDRLYGLGLCRRFQESISGNFFDGTIRGIDETGHLVIAINKRERSFAVNELRFIY